MTKKKANPSKRGKQPVSRLVHRTLLARWDRSKKQHPLKGSSMTAAERTERFLKENRDWLRQHRLMPNGDQQLRNLLTEARKARAAVYWRRREQRRVKALYLFESEKHALGLPSLCSEPFYLSVLKADPK